MIQWLQRHQVALYVGSIGLTVVAHDQTMPAGVLLVFLLPVYLGLMAGSDVVSVVEVEPFLKAFAVLIVAPLGAAIPTQPAVRARAGRVLDAAALAAMVPLMTLTLAAVVTSRIAGFGARLSALLVVVTQTLVELLVMVAMLRLVPALVRA